MLHGFKVKANRFAYNVRYLPSDKLTLNMSDNCYVGKFMKVSFDNMVSDLLLLASFKKQGVRRS